MRAPEGLSLHNVLSGRVSAVHTDPGLDHVIVQVAVGRQLVLAEVTEDAIDRLKIAVGAPVYALIKSVSIDVLTVENADRASSPESRASSDRH